MIVDERIAAYLTSLEKEMPEYLREIEQKAKRDGVPIIKKQAQSLLRFLLTSKKPSAILEVGTAIGFSALFMKEYMKEYGTINTIEKVPARIHDAKENFAREDKERKITLIEGEALEILKDLENKKKQFDFIFMDAAKAQYIHFLPHVLNLLESNAILVTDNILQDGDIIESRFGITRRDRTIHSRMREYLYELTHNENIETVLLPVGDGIALSTKL